MDIWLRVIGCCVVLCPSDVCLRQSCTGMVGLYVLDCMYCASCADVVAECCVRCVAECDAAIFALSHTSTQLDRSAHTQPTGSCSEPFVPDT